MNWQQVWATVGCLAIVAFLFFLAILSFRMAEEEAKHPETAPQGDVPGCGPGCCGIMLIILASYILILLFRALSGDLI
jgi:hypothetical protein